MYDINAQRLPQAQDLTLGKGVVDEEGGIAYAKMAQEQHHQEKEDQARIEAASQAQLNAKLAKIGNAIDPVEQEDIGKKQAEYIDLVHQKSGDLQSKDAKKRIAASIELSQAENNLNNTVKQSNARYLEKTHAQHFIDEVQKSNPGSYYDEEIKGMQDAFNKSYVNTPNESPIKYVPTPHADLNSEWKTKVLPTWAKTGIVTNNAKFNSVTGQQENNYQTDKTENIEAGKNALIKDQKWQNELTRQVNHVRLSGDEEYGKVGDPITSEVLKKRIDDLFPTSNYAISNTIKDSNAPAANGAAAQDKKPVSTVTTTDDGTSIHTDTKMPVAVTVNGVSFPAKDLHVNYDNDGKLTGATVVNENLVSDNQKNEQALSKALQKADVGIAAVQAEYRKKHAEANGDETLIDAAKTEMGIQLAKLNKDKSDAAIEFAPVDATVQLKPSQAVVVHDDIAKVHPDEILNGKTKKVNIIQNDQRTKGGASQPAKEVKQIRVKRKSDGKTGTINESDFNDSKYERL